MAKVKSSQKKVSLSELNNHSITNKRQALKDLSNRGSSTGDATFTNLPFTVGDYVSGSSHEGSGQITWWQNTNTTDNWSFWISQSSTNATIYGTFGNGSGSVSTTTHGHYQNNSAFRFHLSYMAQ